MPRPVNIYCEWGLDGIRKLSPVSDVIIIVDVLSFSTCVDIAAGNKAFILPYKFKDESAVNYASLNSAELASFSRSRQELSLSPSSLTKIKPGTRLVLPSPNGSELSLSTESTMTLCACLRNADAVAEYVLKTGGNISVIPAGEKWKDGSMRFALEDYLGAGAVISCLKGNFIGKAEDAMLSFRSFKKDISRTISMSISGVELIEKGFEDDIALACEINVSASVPLLSNNIYKNAY